MNNTKFIRLVEKVKRGTADVYDGIEISRDDETITIVGCGPYSDSHLSKHILDLEEYRIEPSTSDEIKYHFSQALLKMEVHVLDKEFNLAEEQRDLDKAKDIYDRYFANQGA